MSPLSVREYLLTQPQIITLVHRDLSTIPEGHVVVDPVVAGICASDLAYFFGRKDPIKLQQRLPVALLHEGVVRNRITGELAVAIPLQSCGECEACCDAAENVCHHAKFMGSTAQGLTRSPFIYPTALLLPLIDTIPPALATLTEPLSIAVNLVSQLSNITNQQVMIIGTGPMAYLGAVLFSQQRNVSAKRLFVVGTNTRKLEKFSPFATTIDMSTTAGQAAVEALKENIDIGIEAVGGDALAVTFNQLLQLIKNRGTIAMIGLSDKSIPSQLIHVVNKGLRIMGVTRSTIAQYREALALLTDQTIRDRLAVLIEPRQFVIQNENDLMNAFHFTAAGQHCGKVLVTFPNHLSS